MQRRNIVIGILLSLFAWSDARAQDPMFTQLYSAPLELNPALAGAIDGSFRLSALYRDQWGGALENPWQTYAVSGDLRFNLVDRAHSDFIGAGVQFLADRVADYDYNTMGIKISGAFHKNLSQYTKQYLSGGFYFGLLQRNINIDALTFDDQFNGLDGFSRSTLENLPTNNFAYFDMGLGLNYSISPSDMSQFSGGISLSHINNPSASFAKRSPEIMDPDDVRLYMRWTTYVSAVLGLNKALDILPRVSVTGQGPFLLVNVGANVRFDVNKYETSAVHLGAGIQLARDLESVAPSAAFLFAGFEIGKVLLGLSYDFNLNDLANERIGQGVLEFSVTYIGDYDNSASFCPQF